MHKKKSQSILDFIFAFIAILVLTIGLVRIWMWFHANYASRQVAFQESRLSAGIAGIHSTYERFGYKPVDIGSSEECPDCVYKPLDLTEEWVFRGQPSGTVTAPGEGEGPPGAGSIENTCKTQCLSAPDCVNEDGTFNFNCTCYAQCMCNAQIQPTITIYQDQIRMFNEQAAMLRASAESMRDAAEKCDDPWELCWWGDWGRTPRELRRAARKLDWTADDLLEMAARLQNQINRMQACCNYTTPEQQASCLDQFSKETECETDCYNRTHGVYVACRESYGSGGWPFGFLWTNWCKINYQLSYYNCASPCKTIGIEPCEQRVNSIIAFLQEQINLISESGIDNLINEINTTIAECNAEAQEECSNLDPWEQWQYRAQCETECEPTCAGKYGWEHQICMDECVDNCVYQKCYEDKRNDCCKNCCHSLGGDPTYFGAGGSQTPSPGGRRGAGPTYFAAGGGGGLAFWQGGGWGRNCDTPTTNCDEECLDSCTPQCSNPGQDVDYKCYEQCLNACPKCGLSELARRLQMYDIDNLRQAIEELPNCCNYPSDESQNDCIMDILDQYVGQPLSGD